MYVFLNFHFHIIALCLLCCSVWQLLLLCLLRWRNERLPAIYVRMQNAAQAKAIQQPERVPNDGEKGLMEVYPKISVVVPVCREVDDLEPLLISLLGQQYAGWYEIVVANEGGGRASGFAARKDDETVFPIACYCRTSQFPLHRASQIGHNPWGQGIER